MDQKDYQMDSQQILADPAGFSALLFEKMQQINAGIAQMELYEFRYALGHMLPQHGWESVVLKSPEEVEVLVNRREFYSQVKIKEKAQGRIILDDTIVSLTNMLFVGLITQDYDPEWIKRHFYFDIRGFFFLHRTTYFTAEVLEHLGGEPFKRFENTHAAFEAVQDIGYQAFKEANHKVDALFIEAVGKLVAQKGTPVLLAIAGPTAAGKTEIVERLRELFVGENHKVTTIELDNFLTDREYREEKGIFTQGKEAFHFGLFVQALKDILTGKKISIPRYDFVFATSSHDLESRLKPDGVPIEIEPADIIFIEGNFPFRFEEVIDLIDIKVVYLTDDPIRFKRKWKRDIDYRKKYEPRYFCNRYFKDQFIMAELSYRPQMAVCDLVVDTTGAALWTTPEIAAVLLEENRG